jgi:predicted Zn-dependent protease
MRRGDWKYIGAPEPELYDLRADPGEARNLVNEQPARAAALGRELEALPVSDADGASRPDPKDRRRIAARIAEVTSGELRGPLLERALREIIRDDPGNAVANLRLGEILADSGRCGEAVRRFRTAIAAHAPGNEAERGLARCAATAKRVTLESP